MAKNEAGEEYSISSLHVLGLLFFAMSFVYDLDYVSRSFENKRV